MDKTQVHTTHPLSYASVVDEFRRILRGTFASDLRAIVLYGSYARGDNDDGSDIHLLLLFKDGQTAAKAGPKVRELASQFMYKHESLISALPVSEREYERGRSPLFLNAKREGIYIIPDEVFEMRPEVTRLLKMAHSSLDAAYELVESEKEYSGFGASRAYYAMFYAAEAALLSKGLSYSGHRGVIAGFGQHFVKEGIMPRDLQGSLQAALDLRSLGDYSTEPFPEEAAETVLRDARVFVEAIEGYVKTLEDDSTPSPKPESTEGRPWGQPLKKPAGAPLNLG